MDFTSLENVMYGDVENDDELMAELFALEREEQSRNIKKERNIVPKIPKPSPYQGKPSIPTANVFNPKMLDIALADIGNETLSEDDGEIDDPDLLDELSELVEDETGNREKKISSSNDRMDIAVDSAMLQRLQSLKVEYKELIAKTKEENNGSKLRRYQRAFDNIEELVKKVLSGKTINEEEIPISVQSVKAVPRKIPGDDQPLISITDKDISSEIAETGFKLDKKPPIPPRSSQDSSLPASSSLHKLPPPIQPEPVDHLGSSLASSSSNDPVPFSSKQVNKIEGSTKLDSPPPPPPPKRKTTVENIPTKRLSQNSEMLSVEQKCAESGSGKLLNADQLREFLRSRKNAYIDNATLANEAGDKKSAYDYYVVAKQFDEAIKAVNQGEITECYESDLPPSPIPFRKTALSPNNDLPRHSSNLLEALTQRFEKYSALCEQSKTANDSRKLRMYTRIKKQYEEVIKLHKSGKPVDTSELPCPPGFPPLPNQPTRTMGQARPSGSSINTSPATKPRIQPQVGPLAPALNANESRQSQQLAFLLDRQLQFKKAAILSKKKGDMEQAKKFLIAAKGFDQMIEASRSGLPVDIKGAPLPPQVQTPAKAMKPALGPQESLDASDIIEGSRENVYAALERDLIRQLRFCEENRLSFTRFGDVSRVRLFEDWSSITKRDLLLLRQLAKTGSPVPRFRYENRSIPSVEVFPDIRDDQLELTISRVLNAKLPAGWQPTDGNIFVKYEFSFPHDNHQFGKTKLVYGGISPEFEEKFMLSINRKSKQLLRIIKRNCLKFEVYQKGGFLRSDKLLGTADYRLSILENKAFIHESVDLMEGRKTAGGKIEFKVRVYESLGEKKLDMRHEKWLLLES